MSTNADKFISDEIGSILQKKVDSMTNPNNSEIKPANAYATIINGRIDVDSAGAEKLNEPNEIQVTVIPTADLERLKEEAAKGIEAWTETARFHCNNEFYYRGLVEKIGEMFGKEAYVCDSGDISQDILCAKVPELVEALKKENEELRRKLGYRKGIWTPKKLKASLEGEK